MHICCRKDASVPREWLGFGLFIYETALISAMLVHSDVTQNMELGHDDAASSHASFSCGIMEPMATEPLPLQDLSLIHI